MESSFTYDNCATSFSILGADDTQHKVSGRKAHTVQQTGTSSTSSDSHGQSSPKFWWWSFCHIEIPFCQESAHQILTWSHQHLAEGTLIWICFFFDKKFFVKIFIKVSVSYSPFPWRGLGGTFLKDTGYTNEAKCLSKFFPYLGFCNTWNCECGINCAFWWGWAVVSQLWLKSEKEF